MSTPALQVDDREQPPVGAGGVVSAGARRRARAAQIDQWPAGRNVAADGLDVDPWPRPEVPQLIIHLIGKDPGVPGEHLSRDTVAVLHDRDPLEGLRRTRRHRRATLKRARQRADDHSDPPHTFAPLACCDESIRGAETPSRN